MVVVEMPENSGDKRGLGERRDERYGYGATRTVPRVDREYAGVARRIQVMGAVGSVSLAWSGAGVEEWLTSWRGVRGAAFVRPTAPGLRKQGYSDAAY